jgi:hypothetical protein
MDRGAAAAAIRKLLDEGKLTLSSHAKKRSPETGKQPLTRAQIESCLRSGVITEGPYPDIREPGWKVTVTRFREGEKHEVVAVIVPDKMLLVITAYEWQR